jgi:hypothetical protein
MRPNLLVVNTTEVARYVIKVARSSALGCDDLAAPESSPISSRNTRRPEYNLGRVCSGSYTSVSKGQQATPRFLQLHRGHEIIGWHDPIAIAKNYGRKAIVWR